MQTDEVVIIFTSLEDIRNVCLPLRVTFHGNIFVHDDIVLITMHSFKFRINKNNKKKLCKSILKDAIRGSHVAGRD